MAARLSQAYVRRKLSRMTGTSAICPGERSGTNGIRALIIAAGLLAFAIKITLALNTYGTNDVVTWEQNLKKLQAKGALALYEEGVHSFSPSGQPYEQQVFVHPPFIIHVLKLWAYATAVTNLPLRFWLRFTCSVA